MRFLLVSFGLEIILLLSVIFLVWIGVQAKRSLLKYFCFNLSAVFIALFLYEFVLTLINKPQSEVVYSEPYYEHSPDLGYSVRNTAFSTQVTKRWIDSGEKIYSAKYSLSNGRRVTPNSDSLSKRYGVFLGGSCTFGEGVNDKETLPYYYNEHSTEKLNIRNYGFHGYGTHQVYTIVKNQIVRDTVLQKAENVDVFYWFINPHILRSNGYSVWDQNGPSYALENGRLKYTGTFNKVKSTQTFLTKFLNFIWTNAAIYSGPLGARLATGEEEVNLFLALVDETNQLLKSNGFTFMVLMQDMSKNDAFHQAILERIKLYFKTHDIEFIDINEILPQKQIDGKPLRIPADNHPTGEFNKLLADFLWKKNHSNATSKNH